MKKIEVKGEVTNVMYEAIDGTKFKDEKQCGIYEGTAKCIIQSRLKIKTLCETDIVWGGACDNVIKVISGKPEDIAMYVALLDTEKDTDLKEILNSNEPWIVEINFDKELVLVSKVSDYINDITKKLTIND